MTSLPKKIAFFLFITFSTKIFCSIPPAPLVDRFWVEYTLGDTVGVNGDYGTLAFLSHIPSCIDDNFFWIGEVDFHALKRKSFAANAGGGFRYLSNTRDRLFGMNFFYDHRGNYLHAFHQLGVGCEYFSPLFDCLANFYIPIATTKKKVGSELFDDYIGDYFAQVTDRDQTFSGFNVEVGKRYCLSNRLLINPAFGPYYFSNLDQSFWGWKCRLNLELNSMLSFKVDVTRDRVFKTRIDVVLGLIVPLEQLFCGTCSACYDLLNYRTQRFRLIPLTRTSDWLWSW